MYKITITETRAVQKDVGNQWTVLGRAADGSEPRGYTPTHIVESQETFKVYEQEFEDLDLQSAVVFLNGGAKSA